MAARVVVGGNHDFTQKVRSANLEITAETAAPTDLYSLVEQMIPDVVLTMGTQEWLDVVSVLAGSRRNMVFYVSGEFGLAQWRQIRRSGCVAVSGDPEQAASQVAAATAGIGSDGFRYDDRPVPQIEVPKVDVVRGGLIVAVFGIKGGIGKTEIALNFACAGGMWAANLARSHGQEFKVLLLDYNSDYGTSKVKLGLYSRVLNPNAKKVYSVGDMDDPSLGLRRDDFVSRLNYYKKANLYFLAPPQTPEERISFNADLAGKILDMGGTYFDLVVVDLGTALERRDPAIVALAAAKKIIFLVEPYHDVIATNAEFTKTDVRALDVDITKMSSVVNHAHAPTRAKQVYSPAEVARSLGIPVVASFPYEPRITESVPYICVDQRSRFSREIIKLVRSVLGSSSIEIARPKRFGLF